VGCREWRRRAKKEALRGNGAAERLAETVVQRVRSAMVAERLPELRLLPAPASGQKQLLMVDLHCHTVYSDGRMSLRELVDFYGRRGFDAMAVTDHVVDKGCLIGRLTELTGLVMTKEDLSDYFRALQEERSRAWIKYRMILFPGMEFNLDGLTAKRSAHLLGVDLKEPIDPGMKLKEICQAVRSQGGLTIAAHPHHMTSMWGRDTLFLWERQEEYKPYIDAWEIGNRDDLFNPVGLTSPAGRRCCFVKRIPRRSRPASGRTRMFPSRCTGITGLGEPAPRRAKRRRQAIGKRRRARCDRIRWKDEFPAEKLQDSVGRGTDPSCWLNNGNRQLTATVASAR
ncbi:MAG: hypothetical protein EBZ05_09445, partial [Verrucomicrobia bacterium]|nr:hypothetical protein [Verrucomicrobiota bacterium]